MIVNEGNVRNKHLNLIGLLLLMTILVSLAGCGSNSSGTQEPSSLPTNESKVTTTQGIWGNVWFWEGDFMPTAVGTESSSGKITPVTRGVVVCQTITTTEMSPYISGAFYSQLPHEIIAETSSDQTGFYQVALPPGTYSVFVKEGSVYYANRFDGQGRVNPVEVLPGTVTKLQLDINYQATF